MMVTNGLVKAWHQHRLKPIMLTRCMLSSRICEASEVQDLIAEVDEFNFDLLHVSETWHDEQKKFYNTKLLAALDACPGPPAACWKTLGSP